MLSSFTRIDPMGARELPAQPLAVIAPFVGWRLSFFAVVLLFCALPSLLLAHDSPEHQVELLTSIMASQGKSESLLVKRAIEYRVLGQLDKAVQDLQQALQ